MIEYKDPPRENPSPKRKAFPSNMPRPCRMRGLLITYHLLEFIQRINLWKPLARVLRVELLS
jgi:hypothetical protein